MKNISEIFTHIADRGAKLVGSPFAFAAALTAIVLWAVCGPFLGFSDTWQLVINTSTTIITFLTVFLIQNAQNRDSQSIEIKLNELIKATKSARNALIDIEELSSEELEKLHKEYEKFAAVKLKSIADKK
jgi:low affinity Fe/Cu permease